MIHSHDSHYCADPSGGLAKSAFAGASVVVVVAVQTCNFAVAVVVAVALWTRQRPVDADPSGLASVVVAQTCSVVVRETFAARQLLVAVAEKQEDGDTADTAPDAHVEKHQEDEEEEDGGNNTRAANLSTGSVAAAAVVVVAVVVVAVAVEKDASSSCSSSSSILL
jgi:hypothetical protein